MIMNRTSIGRLLVLLTSLVLLLAACAEQDSLPLEEPDAPRALRMLEGWSADPNSGADGRFATREADLFLGNAGTAIRPLTAVLALASGSYRLSDRAGKRED